MVSKNLEEVPLDDLSLEFLAGGIVNMISGLIGLLSFMGSMLFGLITVIMFISESSKPVVVNQKKSYKKTIIFAIITGVCVLGLILSIVTSVIVVPVLLPNT